MRLREVFAVLASRHGCTVDPHVEEPDLSLEEQRLMKRLDSLAISLVTG